MVSCLFLCQSKPRLLYFLTSCIVDSADGTPHQGPELAKRSNAEAAHKPKFQVTDGVGMLSHFFLSIIASYEEPSQDMFILSQGS